ncbi:MAG: nucleotidyl transferase AbiEii/AbiGii toxin family protein [Lautropia sp.]|nr:nucleotidyl transferase AbiEii/AbiGii toxin family protein [Lautropia sp.]
MNQRNTAASVRARLLSHARQTQQDFNLVLTRYALERLLYRISISRHANQFLLKGALLFDLWFDIPHRPTRDADFLGFGSSELTHLADVFKEICSINAEDGVSFLTDTVRSTRIRKEANYTGMRVTLLGLIDGARCPMQIDMGFGDAVTPEPEVHQFPVILSEFPAPKLRVYPRYTVVAEKLEALSTLGIANTRMKDYFDLWFLSQHAEFDGNILKTAIQATFKRRKTRLPAIAPFGLTDNFSQDPVKQTQWRAFLTKNQLEAPPLNTVITCLRAFLAPAITAAAIDADYSDQWPAGGPWSAMTT